MMNRTTRNSIIIIWPPAPAFFMTIATFFCNENHNWQFYLLWDHWYIGSGRMKSYEKNNQFKAQTYMQILTWTKSSRFDVLSISIPKSSIIFSCTKDWDCGMNFLTKTKSIWQRQLIYEDQMWICKVQITKQILKSMSTVIVSSFFCCRSVVDHYKELPICSTNSCNIWNLPVQGALHVW